MAEQPPNCGVKWILGCYKIELTVFPVSGSHSRNVVIENESGVIGLYHHTLLSKFQDDVDTLKATVEDIIAKAQGDLNGREHDVQDSKGEQSGL